MCEIKSRGIDVSEWQGQIDWEKVKANGVDFAFLRCGYGKDLSKQDDAYFVRNANECESLGIAYGVYLFSYATSVADAKSEATHVLRLLEGRKLQYPVFYDLEDGNTTGKLSNTKILEIAKTFVETVEAAGYTVGIYANYYWNTTKLTDPWYDAKPRWIAQYNDTNDYEGAYDFWQYSNSGTMPGVPGNCDMNYGYVDYSATNQTKAGETPYTLNAVVLRRGMKGEKIEALQHLLIGKGYSCGYAGVDGSFGPDTENAVLLYQEDHDLEADANVGPMTLSSLLGY